jgi:tRNA pseudouridine38-40 synthase
MHETHRLALGLEYDGTNYNGWQIQSHAPSIQSSLNDALSAVADERIDCVGAGRTDTGVHAGCQVVHFDTHASREMRSWLLGANSNLADDINVLWVKEVAGDFHARFSALARSYRYRIINRPVRSALERHRAWWVRRPLDVEAMQAGAECLIGQHDFSSFRASSCQSKSPVRTIHRLRIRRDRDLVTMDCEANAFLHHMVRNLVGSLARVGYGEAEPSWIASLLAEKDRRLADITAPPSGLCLNRIQYPSEFGLDGLIGE